MPKYKRTIFQYFWLKDSKFQNWLQSVPEKPDYARCILCPCNIFSSNMGKQALLSHMKSKKHISHRSNPASLKSVLTSSARTTTADSSNSVISSAPVDTTLSDLPQPLAGSSIETSNVKELLPSQSAPRRLDVFLFKDDVTTAEVLWCLETVMSHKSLRSAEKDVDIFKTMFHDSDIAKKMQLKKTKISYTIMFGIASFFNEGLIHDLNNAALVVVGFDESLNKVTKRQQMDMNVRFWDDGKKEIVTRYLTSRFLGRSRAVDLLEEFKKGIANLRKDKLLQISMDGPNVNLVFIKEFNLEFSSDVKLLDIGSCGLHRLHCAFKAGMCAVPWDIVSYLRAIYNLFKDVPVRRALYTQYSESNIFPLKFCSIRWLENSEVAQRAIDITPHIKKFVEGVRKDKIEPTCKSYILVAKFIKDPLLCAKLAFFKSLASNVEPFLREFQSDAPLVPFLHTALSLMLKTVLDRFMKPEVIKNISLISLQDVEKEDNLFPAKDIFVGFDALKILKKINIKTIDIIQFRQDCKKCLKKFVCKIMVHSPLKYTLTKAATCLDPNLIVSNLDLVKKRLHSLCSILTDNDRLSGSTADVIVQEFQNFTSRPYIMEAIKSYDRSQKRLDHFWRDILGQDFKNFMHMVKMICCLSHGNANIGFSVNAECLFENMREESVIARRQVYDSVLYHGGIGNLQISKGLLVSARNAHSRYIEDVKLRREQMSIIEQERSLKRKKNLEAKELEMKRIKILESAQKEAEALQEQIAILKK